MSTEHAMSAPKREKDESEVYGVSAVLFAPVSFAFISLMHIDGRTKRQRVTLCS
jgi:hypothetical protein